MKKFFTYLFVGMGVLFLLQLIALAYFYIVDPLNLKPLLFGENGSAESSRQTSGEDQSISNAEVEAQGETQTLPASNLSPAQERALEMVGVEPESIPQSFTEEQLRCFVAVLGQSRVDEIKAGATPSMSEYYQAKDCI